MAHGPVLSIGPDTALVLKPKWQRVLMMMIMTAMTEMTMTIRGSLEHGLWAAGFIFQKRSDHNDNKQLADDDKLRYLEKRFLENRFHFPRTIRP